MNRIGWIAAVLSNHDHPADTDSHPISMSEKMDGRVQPYSKASVHWPAATLLWALRT